MDICLIKDQWFKFIGIYSPADLKNTMSEVSKMSELSHPNVMNLVGVCTGLTQGPGIVMPYMANGSVLDYLKKERKNLYLQFDADDETVSTCVWFSLFVSNFLP